MKPAVLALLALEVAPALLLLLLLLALMWSMRRSTKPQSGPSVIQPAAREEDLLNTLS